MDGQQFDAVVQMLLVGTPRRSLLAGLTGGLVTGAIAIPRAESEAKRKRKKRRKKKHKAKCPLQATGKINGLCVQHCDVFEDDCPEGDFCGRPVDAETEIRFCGAVVEPFCRSTPDDVTCGDHDDCDPGQLCVITACLPICVTPTFG